MRFFFMDIGSTFVKLSVYDSDKKEYLLTQKVPFPTATVADGVHFTVERRAIDAVIGSAVETARTMRVERCSSACRCTDICCDMQTAR